MGRAAALISFALGACSGGTDKLMDAAVQADSLYDASADADLISYTLNARYLDWDSTAAAPCPIVGATWTARYDDTRTATTDASGAFHIRLATYLWLIDVKQPAAPSSCALESSAYTMPVFAIVPSAVGYPGGQFVMRAPTAARVTTLFAAIGSAFDTTRGQLHVHIDGTARAVSISSSHAAAQAFDGATWSAGATGVDVFFPNIELGTYSTTTVTVAGGATGTGSVPLAAGTLTHLTVETN